MWEMLLKPISDVVNNVIDKVAVDATTKEQLKKEIATQLITVDASEFEQRAKIVLAEVNGESWLQRNWRPMLMIWFAILVGAHWFGMTPENLDKIAISKLFDIVQLGVGGYIIGRSGEKMMREYKK